MSRAASDSASRTCPASGPLTPVTVTERTATSGESRSHSHIAPSTPRTQRNAAVARSGGRGRRVGSGGRRIRLVLRPARARTLPVGVVASRAWRPPPRRSCATSRRCASAAPPAASSRRATRTRSSTPSAAPTRAGEPLLVLAGGSNVVVADAGFPGTVVRVATRGVDRAEAATAASASRSQAGEPWDPFVARCVADGPGGRRVPVGHPGLGRRDADPERRRVRPGGRRDDRARCACSTARAARSRDLAPDGVRLRLPLERVQARPRAAGSCSP